MRSKARVLYALVGLLVAAPASAADRRPHVAVRVRLPPGEIEYELRQISPGGDAQSYVAQTAARVLGTRLDVFVFDASATAPSAAQLLVEVFDQAPVAWPEPGFSVAARLALTVGDRTQSDTLPVTPRSVDQQDGATLLDAASTSMANWNEADAFFSVIPFESANAQRTEGAIATGWERGELGGLAGEPVFHVAIPNAKLHFRVCDQMHVSGLILGVNPDDSCNTLLYHPAPLPQGLPARWDEIFLTRMGER